MKTIFNYINGELIAPIQGQYLDNVSPIDGLVFSQIPDSNQEDIDAAVDAAEAAFPIWSKTPAAERSKILVRLADLIAENASELAKAESIDNGKPLSLSSSVDIPRAESNIRFFATSIIHFASEAHIMED
ncbi:MAG: aldehyde dehydrogenase family protein, partial [Flavobacteriales bacterium]